MLKEIRSIRMLMALSMLLAPLVHKAAAQTGPGVYITYTLVKTDLTVNEPVFLRFSVENRQPEPLKLRVGSNDNGCCDFQVKIIRPDGREEIDAQISPYDTRGNEVVGNARIEVQPFSQYTKLLLVNQWFRFDLPGRYFLDIDNREPSLEYPIPKPPYQTGAHITIDVGPRNPERLKQICADLEKAIMASSGRPDDDLMALAHLDDPVAIPFIARLLDRQNSLGWILPRSLARIGTEDAVDVLISLAASAGEEETRATIRGILTRMAAIANDPAIRAKVEAFRR